jgi:hypothetical protein
VRLLTGLNQKLISRSDSGNAGCGQKNEPLRLLGAASSAGILVPFLLVFDLFFSICTWRRFIGFYQSLHCRARVVALVRRYLLELLRLCDGILSMHKRCSEPCSFGPATLFTVELKSLPYSSGISVTFLSTPGTTAAVCSLGAARAHHSDWL